MSTMPIRFPTSCTVAPSQKNYHQHGECLPGNAHLQQPGELGLPVGDVSRLLVRQRLDDLAQRGERQVDALALRERSPGVVGDPCIRKNQCKTMDLLLREYLKAVFMREVSAIFNDFVLI